MWRSHVRSCTKSTSRSLGAVWVQSGRSTRSAVDIFNTLRVFPKEPIRKQEIELGVYEWFLIINEYVGLWKKTTNTKQSEPNRQAS